MANDAAVVAGSVQLLDGVTKEILKPAEASECQLPTKGDECTVRFTLYDKEEGEEIDSSEARGESTTFKLGDNQVINGLNVAVATMRSGEKARFEFSPEYAYGEEGLPPQIPPNAILVYDVTLVSWKKSGDLFGDGGVMMSTLVEGIGLQVPAKGDTCLCGWKIATAGGEVLDEQDMLEYAVGSEELGPLSRSIDKALPDMRSGQRVKLYFRKDYAWGDEDMVAELALKRVVPIDDVSPRRDRSLLKKQVVQGKGGQKPQDNDLVWLAVEGAFFSSGQKPAGFVGRVELNFSLGDGDVCDALEFAAAQMLPEERAVVICSKPSMCVEPKLGLKDVAKVQGDLNIMVTLQRYQSAATGASDEDIFARAAQRKEVGGRLFKAQRYDLALARYSSAVGCIKQCNALDSKGAELVRVCELNTAACLLKLGDHRGAKSACTAVLKDEPTNVKALFRRASARLELEEFAEAASDLQQLLEVDAGNKEAQRLLAQATRGNKEQQKRAASVCAKMTKAMDGEFAEEQARKAEAARYIKKPGQVLSQAESDKAMEEAWAFAHTSLEKYQQARDEKERAECAAEIVDYVENANAVATQSA